MKSSSLDENIILPASIPSLSDNIHSLSSSADLVALERNFNGPVIITSTQGGSNIEEIAEENPDAIIRHPIDVTTGLRREDALSIGERLGFRDGALEEVCLSLLINSIVEQNVHFLVRLRTRC